MTGRPSAEWPCFPGGGRRRGTPGCGESRECGAVTTTLRVLGRCDRSHLHEFTRADGNRLGRPSTEVYDPDSLLAQRSSNVGPTCDGSAIFVRVRVCRPAAALCRVGPQRFDSYETLEIASDRPLPYFRWGDIPDPYHWRWDGDDRDSSPLLRPVNSGLPPLLPGWRRSDSWRL